MANLETLEIRVAANAESAAQGLSHLIGSLSALSRGVGKAVGGLTRLNGELAKTSTASTSALGTLANGFSNVTGKVTGTVGVAPFTGSVD